VHLSAKSFFPQTDNSNDACACTASNSFVSVKASPWSRDSSRRHKSVSDGWEIDIHISTKDRDTGVNQKKPRVQDTNYKL